MRSKAAAAAVGAVLVAALAVAIVIFSGTEEQTPASLSVPMPSQPPDDWTPTRPPTTLSIIPPAAPIVTEPPPPPTSSAPPPARVVDPPVQPPPPPVAVPNAFGRISFYGARTNEPPGSRAIAFPNSRHRQAGGTGTFEDPLTFAAREGEYRPGTRIYVPDLKRYFVFEDVCPRCSETGVNLWAGDATDSGLLDCMRSLNRSGDRPYVINPPAGLPVVPGDLYESGRCYKP